MGNHLYKSLKIIKKFAEKNLIVKYLLKNKNKEFIQTVK